MAEIIGKFTEVDQYIRIYYETCGEGAPIICLPTAGESTGEYRHVLRYFGERGYQAIALDPPGHGNSYPDLRDLSVPRTPDDYVDFVWRFTQVMNFQNPIFIGYAVSGTLVLLLAAKYGKDIRAVVAGEGNNKLGISPIQLNSLNHPGINMADLMESTTPGLCGDDEPVEVMNEAIWHNARHAVPEVIEADLTIYNQIDVTDRLADIPCPVLHTKGDHDYCVTEISMKMLPERIPKCKQVILENTGHYVPIERPELLCRTVEEFIAEYCPA